MPSPLMAEAEVETVFGPGDEAFLERVVRMARDYPHPHSIFGGPQAGDYVRQLAARSGVEGEGWYGVGTEAGDLAAVHLAIYGEGDGNGHALFKLRHPLFSGEDGPHCLTGTVQVAARAAARIRPGTQKLVMFLGEREQQALEAVERAGYALEGTLADYYRLEERCFVLGYTERGSV